MIDVAPILEIGIEAAGPEADLAGADQTEHAVWPHRVTWRERPQTWTVAAALALAWHVFVALGIDYGDRNAPPPPLADETAIPVDLVPDAPEPVKLETPKPVAATASTPDVPSSTPAEPPTPQSVQPPLPAATPAANPPAQELAAAPRPSVPLAAQAAPPALVEPPQVARPEIPPQAREAPTPPALAKPSPDSPAIQFLPDTFREAALDTTPPPSKEEQDSYQASVFDKLIRQRQYPAAARTRREAGLAVVSFVLDSAGNLAGVSLLRSTGHADLDTEAIAMVRRAAPYPKPPSGATLTFTPSIEFGLDETDR